MYSGMGQGLEKVSPTSGMSEVRDGGAELGRLQPGVSVNMIVFSIPMVRKGIERPAKGVNFPSLTSSP